MRNAAAKGTRDPADKGENGQNQQKVAAAVVCETQRLAAKKLAIGCAPQDP